MGNYPAGGRWASSGVASCRWESSRSPRAWLCSPRPRPAAPRSPSGPWRRARRASSSSHPPRGSPRGRVRTPCRPAHRRVSSSARAGRGPLGRPARGDRARARDLRQPEAVRRPRGRPAVRGAPRHGRLQGGRRARRQQRAARRFDQRAQLRRLATRRRRCNGAIVHVWGSASHASVRDTRLDGNRRVETGLLVRQAQGFVGRRIVASALPKLRGRRRPERRGLPDAIAVRAAPI